MGRFWPGADGTGGGDGFDAIGGNLDPPVDDYLTQNVNYLRVVLGVKLPPLK